MQLSLLGRETPRFDARFVGADRRDLGGDAWIEHVPSWVTSGQASLFYTLEAEAPWQQTSQIIYEREVNTPRLVASTDDASFRWPILGQMIEALSLRYRTRIDRVSFALYRDGNDSVAFHRDRVLRNQEAGIVATVSLGGPRAFHLRPHETGSAPRERPTLRFHLGLGDLMVMGGACQRTWEHAVPKTKRPAAQRIAIMFRPVDANVEARISARALLGPGLSLTPKLT